MSGIDTATAFETFLLMRSAWATPSVPAHRLLNPILASTCLAFKLGSSLLKYWQQWNLCLQDRKENVEGQKKYSSFVTLSCPYCRGSVSIALAHIFYRFRKFMFKNIFLCCIYICIIICVFLLFTVIRGIYIRNVLFVSYLFVEACEL